MRCLQIVFLPKLTKKLIFFCIREVFLKEYFSPLCTTSSLRYVQIMYRVVYNTSLHFLPFFQVPGKRVNYSDTFFSCRTRISKPFFPITSSFPKFACQKSQNYHKYKYISIAFTLCQMKFSNTFQVHKVDRTEEFESYEIHKLSRSSF